MWTVARGIALAVALAVIVADAKFARAEELGLSFRAVGWARGKAEITEESIKCEIPTVSSAIVDGAFQMGLWNTYGFETIYFPDINGPFANPCGGYIQLQNNMFEQAVTLQRVDLQYRIPGARRFMQFGVPTRRGFPLACRQYQRTSVFAGARIDPILSDIDSGSGVPNVAFVQLLPMVNPQLFECLRSQYAGLPVTAFASLQLVIKAKALGIGDSGDRFRSNTIRYTLSLRHLCGNGRVDDGEQCDPQSTGTSCTLACLGGVCEGTTRPCTSAAECVGTCLAPDDPSECSCLY
jgi:hypothetical protein